MEYTTESTLYAEPISHIGTFTITNSILTSWIALFVIIVIVLVFRSKKISIRPTKIQNFFELIVEGALDLCDQVTGNRSVSIKIFPIAFSVFVFILINNWIGILPGVGSIGMIEHAGGENIFVPFFRGASADVNTTLALALMAVIVSNIFGIFVIGAWKSFNKFIKINELAKLKNVFKDPTLLAIAPISFFVGLLEVIGEFAKIASLTFRLYGNVFAGEVLLASMSAIMPFFLPLPFLFLEFFVGLLQAFIFAMLTLVYFTIAATDHDEHTDGHHPEVQHQSV